MTKLHQILAVESGIRTQVQKDLTAAHHGLQAATTLIGFNRTYEPLKEDGEKQPPEQQLLQTRVPDVIKKTVDILEKAYDITAIRDFANCDAKADVVLEDGTIILSQAPAPYLLWLEKQLADVHTFVCKLPTLPADTEWVWDDNQNCYKNKYENRTTKTNKIPIAFQLAPATDKHPAQVVEKAQDVLVGHWTKVSYSGAIPVKTRSEMKERVEALQKAVKFAREKANQVEVDDQKKVGRQLLSYVFGGMA